MIETLCILDTFIFSTQKQAETMPWQGVIISVSSSIATIHYRRIWDVERTRERSLKKLGRIWHFFVFSEQKTKKHVSVADHTLPVCEVITCEVSA